MQRHCVLFALFGLCACTGADPNARETSGEKTEWSVLQAAEFSGRQTVETQPALRTVQGYELLVTPGKDGKNIWIFLNPKSPPYYKQLPAGSFVLSRAYVDQLIQQRKLGYTAEQVLSTVGSQ